MRKILYAILLGLVAGPLLLRTGRSQAFSPRLSDNDDQVVYRESTSKINQGFRDNSFSKSDQTASKSFGPYSDYDDIDSLKAEVGRKLERHQSSAQVATYDDLNLETLKLLVYLHAKLGRHEKADEVASAVFKKAPDDKQTLYALLSMNLESQSKYKVLKLAQRLNRLHPDDTQILYYLGQAYYTNGYYDEANSIFSQLPNGGPYDNTLYPQAFDVVENAFQTGEWAYAANMLIKALETHKELAFDISFEQKERLHDIYKKRLGHVGADFLIKIFDQGSSYGSILSGGHEINDRYKLYGQVDIPVIGLNATDLWRDTNKAFVQGVLGLNYNRNKYEANLYGGAHQDGGIFGGSVTKNFDYGKSISIDGFYGKRSEDTLLLERLNARTTGGGIFAQHAWDGDYKSYVNARVEGRNIEIDGEKVSTALGIYLNFDRQLTPTLKPLRWGYRANYISYSDVGANASIINDIALNGLTPAQRQSLINGLLPDSIHRHGLFLSWKDYLTQDLSYRGMVGYDYDLEQGGGLYYVTGGLTYYLTEQARINADIGYFSDPNIGIAGSDLWQIMLGFQMGF